MAGFRVNSPYDHPLLRFAMYLFDTTLIIGDSISNYVSAVKTRICIHSVAPLPESLMLTTLLQRFRALPRVRKHRDPAPALLIANVMADKGLDLGVRTVIAALWYATLRAGSLSGDRVTSYDGDYALLRQDVVFHDTWVGFRIKSFKGDKYNRGDVVWLAPTGSPGCPVALFKQYWAASSAFEPECPLFRRLSDGGIVTRRAVAWALRLHARAMGVDDKFISAHSIRIGSATQLASANISLQDILMQGRWARTESALRYLRQALPRCERILRALNLETCFDRKSGRPTGTPPTRSVRSRRMVFPLPTRVRV